MDPCVSGVDLVIKARKPYTITKQRERWTEEEHTRFLEALKLYGRAWQRIEEHIGTKTAIQIRSHAQKFFTKLEKEGTVKGEGQALDIEIPPPRPKRKPTNPYPRKTSGAPVLQSRLKDGKESDAASTSLSLTLLKEPEKLLDDAKLRSTEAPCASPNSSDNSSLASEALTKSCTLNQFLPVMNGSSNQIGSAASPVTPKSTGNHADEKQLSNDNTQESSVIMDSCVSPDDSVNVKTPAHDSNNPGNCCQYPRHVPVHILDGSFGRNAQHIPHPAPLDTACMHSMLNRSSGIFGDQDAFTSPNASATSEYCIDGSRPDIQQQPFLNRLPFFPPMPNPHFSSLILSALAQNAAVYAAASFASTFWPWFNMGAPVEPSINSSGVPQSGPVNPTSSMVAIAGATVAAATAWWTANGLLPLYPQYHPGFTCSPAAQMPGCQNENITGEVAMENSDDPILASRQPDPDLPEAQNSALKTPTSSPPETEANEARKLDGGLNPTGTDEPENANDSNMSENKKQLDRRSSCGSNTPSSSEIERDATEMHLDEGNEEPNPALPLIDLFSRRNRSSNNLNDSWKEVSEGGKLAFQALFSRQVLPQSFLPSEQEQGDNHLTVLKLDANREIQNSPLDGQTKPRGYRTGFKLYKRCAMEANETLVPEERKDPKRLRLEGETLHLI